MILENRKNIFSNIASHRGNIKLVEGDKLLQDDSEVAEKLNNFFKEAVLTLNVNQNSEIIINSGSQDLIERAIKQV